MARFQIEVTKMERPAQPTNSHQRQRMGMLKLVVADWGFERFIAKLARTSEVSDTVGAHTSECESTCLDSLA